MVMRLYAPLPMASFIYLSRLLRAGVPDLATELRQVQDDAQSRYAHAEVEGSSWLWPQDETPLRHTADNRLRFLAPFDPVV